MEGVRVRRRLVQSTLFPHKESSVKEGESCDGNQFELGSGNKEQEEVELEEEEECGSSKRRSGSKRKPNSKAKTTRGGYSKKVTKNVNETSSKQIDDGDSPSIVQSSFFAKASERRQHKRQQNQQVFINSPEKSDEICSPSRLAANGRITPQKPKLQHNTSPNKERMNSTPSKKTKRDTRQLFTSLMSFDLTPDEQQSQTIPDLRLEAKLIAEENSRIFAGRKIHPFFTSRKAGKNSQDMTESESKWSVLETKEKGIIFSPIHIFESAGDDHMNLDWGNWIFSEKSASDGLECGFSPVYEGSIKSLNFDNFLSVSNLTQSSSYPNSHQCSIQQKEISMMLLDQPECSHPNSSLLLPDNRIIGDEYQKDADSQQNDKERILATPVEIISMGHKTEKNDFVAGNTSGGNSDAELQERIMSHYHTCHNQHENCLWTDKYQPQNAKQICGNGESVKFLSEWLKLWHKRGSLASNSCIYKDKHIMQDVDYNCQLSDCDSDTINDEESLKNVLLIKGPVGSGKSAAIYTCAREHGFQIIEINASDWRNGALIKQKFGEAVESHWLQRTVENTIDTDNKSLSKLFSAVNTETHCCDNEVIELIPLSDKEDSHNADAWPKRKILGEDLTANNYQNEIKTLILFEDVDATLSEDHGFISTIQQLAETAKRPMILTSNSSNPVLPKNLDRSELSFSVPSLDNVLALVNVICNAEKIKIHPCLLERFVDSCQGDIRKTLMILQFWCQGQIPEQGNKFQTTCSPVLFDLDAGHHILPKMIPWSYPSQLSELVENEVVKSLILMEETPNTSKELDGNRAENIPVQNGELDHFEAKKETMLRLHSSLQNDTECVRFDTQFQHFDSSSSPVAFGRHNCRRSINTVLSSDSEDEFLGSNTPLVSSGLLDVDVGVDVEVVDMNCMPSLPCLPTEICHHASEPVYDSAVEKLEENCFQFSEGNYFSHIHDMCKSLDMSFVPESSFVPETQLISEADLYSTTVSYGHFSYAVGANLTTQDSLPILEPSVGAKLNTPLLLMPDCLETFGNYSDTGTTFVYQEEVGDSLSKCEADVPREYQVLDECSRVNLMNRLKSLDDTEAPQVFNDVQESWNKLRDRRKDLRNYVTAEEKNACQVLKFAHGTSNLISEADLLLRDCQTILFDSLKPSTNPCEKTHSYSYHDDQLEMSSILAQHGICFYAKEILSLGSITGSTISLDLASDMLSSSVSLIALGKLAGWDRREVEILYTKTPKSSNNSKSKSNSCLRSVLQSVVPSRSYLSVKGDAFHEYLSTLSQISRYESSRLSENIGKREQRRARVAQHYLSSGSLAMSLEEISLLGQYNSCKKDHSPLPSLR